jgi:hypothetical protein
LKEEERLEAGKKDPTRLTLMEQLELKRKEEILKAERQVKNKRRVKSD